MTPVELREQCTDQIALICTLFGETANEPIQGIIGVACVIRNRVKIDLNRDDKPDWWGESYKGVCLKKDQFTCWWQSNENTARVYALAEVLITNQTVTLHSGLVAELQYIAEGIILDKFRDHTHGADHYLTTDLLEANPPDWARTGKRVAVLGAHTFFRLSA